MKGKNSEFERVLHDHYSEWNNHDDRRSYCLRQRFGHVDHGTIIGRLTCCTLVTKIMPRTRVFLRMEGKAISHVNPVWKTYSLQVGKLCTDSPTWSPCGHKSMKRCQFRIGPTADCFGRRSKIFQTDFSHSREALVEGGSGSSDKAGETITTTPLPHIPARLKQKQDSAIQSKNPQKVLYWICPERGERQEERPHASTRTKNKQIDLGIRWLCSSVVFLCVLCTMILWTSLLACLAHMFVFSWNENAHTQKTNWQTNASEPKRLLSFRPVEKKLAEVDLQASRMALLR